MTEYQGYVKNGELIVINKPIIKEGTRFVLKVLDAPLSNKPSPEQIAQKLAVLGEITASLKDAENEISDADIADLEKSRITTPREFEL